MDPVRYEDMIPGCYDPVARIADMDVDGVQAALCFPSFPGFGGGTFYRAQDRELALLCVKAWKISISTSGAPPHRIVMSRWRSCRCGISMRPSPRLSEWRRRGADVSFPDSPVPLGLPSFHSDHWDPLWQVCSDAANAVSLHFGSGSYVPGFSFSSMKPVPGQMVIPDAPFAGRSRCSPPT
ncbi:amidohydrolase 2 [Mycolicibacterium fortuitum]|uniref:Amidohydrolase 2 n=1 Tax=Mycolicibacterium fortuitum TaxID=1766 RepID=A0A378U5C2_MYCFO|nr:amidohydrolase 2 [Mycolicibacterium fortuitum]